MSAFTKKLSQIKQCLAQDYGLKNPAIVSNLNSISMKKLQPSLYSSCISRVKSQSRCEIKVSSPECKNENYIIRQPVILETKNSKKKTYSISEDFTQKYNKVKKQVEPFVPLTIPKGDLSAIKQSIQSLQTASTSRNNRQIQIFIEKDTTQNKECMQKLLKKIHILEQQLGTSEKERYKLEVEVENLRKRIKECNQHEKVINKLQGDKYKLKMNVQMLKRELQGEHKKVPKQTVKEIIVQKPVQVRVEVPNYIPGPQRIVQKIVEVQKKIPVEVKTSNPPEIVQKPVYIQVVKPIYLQKPIYIDKPVYVNNPVQKIVEKKVQIPVEIPFQTPVYIDRPVIDESWMMRLRGIQEELGIALKKNHELKGDNHRLRVDNETLRSMIDQLNNSLIIMQRHNKEKNKDIELFLRNSSDYTPVFNQNLVTRDNSIISKKTQFLRNLPSPKSRWYF